MTTSKEKWAHGILTNQLNKQNFAKLCAMTQEHHTKQIAAMVDMNKVITEAMMEALNAVETAIGGRPTITTTNMPTSEITITSPNNGMRKALLHNKATNGAKLKVNKAES
jgi:hypothetical protein